MTGIKICGITEMNGLTAALHNQVERIGLVFAPGSPRQVTVQSAQPLAEAARDRALIVAVLVNPGDKQLARIVSDIAPDFLQLHGKESPERVRSLWKRYHIPIIKAFSIGSTKDIADTIRYSRTAFEFLFDAKPPKDATRAGGYGEAFDWSLLAAAQPSRPWLLAGGLDAQNVAEAIRISGAPMVDISSGVESAPGVKDAALLADFCAAVRTGPTK
ncbi:Phosphoribosylanthranilate isomerase [hydrothermal vent metagenome]|uniref:phosphoribosylanthranilate isomerase n=1 Tax=hydrothermal vent metagenome TaxID=652676 RepID=A0A3B0RKQ9_9ZZZZ